MSDRLSDNDNAPKSSLLIVIANLWLAAVVIAFLFLRIFIYALAAIASVAGWQYLQQLPSRATKILNAMIVAISLSYGCFMIAKARVADIHAAVSAAYASARNHAEVPYLDAIDFLNHDPSARKVLILDRSVAPFYSDKLYLKIIGQWGEDPLPNITSPHQALQHLPDLGGVTTY